MKQQWAERETDLDVKLLAPVPQFSVLESSSTSVTETESLPLPKSIPDLPQARHLPRRVAAPRRREGARQAPAPPAPFPRIGDSPEIALASASSLPTASQAIGAQTLAAISSALAHEVRGPLRWVTSFSELLVQESGTSLNHTGKDYLQRISGAAARLDQVMRDLQKFVTAGIQEPRQQVVSLESALCAVLGTLSSEISAKRGQVTLQRPLPPLKGDAEWVQQCLVRLIDNALKFVSPGVSPLVRVWAEACPGVVRVYVGDNGFGIPPMHHERIFGLFNRLSHDFPGTGAGLALTRQACERMGGRTGVESEPGQGSRFWIELPSAV